MRRKWTAYVTAGIVAAGILGSGQGVWEPITAYAQEATDTEQEAETQETFDAASYVKLLCSGNVGS